MRVVSMVPSWTETLLEASAEVVGRTRFCIHPAERVKSIPTVGGTKNWSLGKLKKLNPELIILDREENTRDMADEAPVEILDTHVSGIADMPRELRRLSKRLRLPALIEMADRYERCLSRQPTPVERLPGVIEWLKKPTGKIERVVYVIWKNPWMTVSRSTFIGSMLEFVLGPGLLTEYSEKYPKFDLDEIDCSNTLVLFSSEPFPFAKHKEELLRLPFASAIVDGESWSWFGVRALRFLETLSL